MGFKDKIECWAKAHAKAIGAALGAAGAFAVAHGVTLPDGWEALVTIAVPTLIVFLAPKNKVCGS